MTALLLLGVAVAAGGRGGRAAFTLAAVAAVGVGGALLIVVAVVVWRRHRELRRRRHISSVAHGRVSRLADLIALGLTAGHNVTGALSAVRPHVDDVLAREVDQVLRFATHRGVAEALLAAPGHASDLWRTIARSVVTGASTLLAVTAFSEARRAETHAAAIERARRLPVKLLFPLALLVLPGFTLVLLGPAVVGALDRLGV